MRAASFAALAGLLPRLVRADCAADLAGYYKSCYAKPIPALPNTNEPRYILPAFKKKQLKKRPLLRELDKTGQDLLNAAYTILANRPQSDPTSLMYQAKLHAYYCGCGGPEVHTSKAFLPWHRGFLYFHERILRQALRDNHYKADDFRLPVWDWEADGQVPEPWRSTPIPARFSLQNNRLQALPFCVDDCKLLSWLFGNFSGSEAGVPGPNASWGLHSEIHSRLGDPMKHVETAAIDPLFYAHHANVDRYWTRRTELIAAEPDDFWKDQWFWYFDEKGKPVCMWAEDLEDTKKLGYFYDPPKRFPLNAQDQAVSVTELSKQPGKDRVARAAFLSLGTVERLRVANFSQGLATGAADAAAAPATPATTQPASGSPFDGTSASVPFRVAFDRPDGLVPGSYYSVYLKKDECNPIAGFGVFGHGEMSGGQVVAAGCLKAVDLKIILDSTDRVELVWAETPAGGDQGPFTAVR